MSDPIRVLQIIGTMNRGGAETLVMELYRHMDRSKVQFDFLVYNYGDEPGAYDEEIKQLGGKLYCAKKRLYREPLAYRREVMNFAKEHPVYRIIHSHLNMRGGFVVQPYRQVTKPLVIAHSHTAFPDSDLKNRTINALGRRLLKNSTDYYLGCSAEAVKTICGEYPDDKTRFLLPNAIDGAKFTYSKSARKNIRQEFQIPEDSFVIGNVARFTGEKNHKFILDTFACLANPQAYLILVGQGDLLPEMRAYAENLGVAERVVFAGVRSDVHDILSACDLFLFPSKGEGLGIVLIEAQANGLPCVISQDVIPEEADVGAGLVHRVSLSEPAEVWARECLNAGGRLAPELAQQAVKNAGYDVTEVARWLQEFYLEHSEA